MKKEKKKEKPATILTVKNLDIDGQVPRFVVTPSETMETSFVAALRTGR